MRMNKNSRNGDPQLERIKIRQERQREKKMRLILLLTRLSFLILLQGKGNGMKKKKTGCCHVWTWFIAKALIFPNEDLAFACTPGRFYGSPNWFPTIDEFTVIFFLQIIK